MKNLNKFMLICLITSSAITFTKHYKPSSKVYPTTKIVYPTTKTIDSAIYEPDHQTVKFFDDNKVMQYKFIHVTEGPNNNDNAVKILQFEDIPNNQRLTEAASLPYYLFGELSQS